MALALEHRHWEARPGLAIAVVVYPQLTGLIWPPHEAASRELRHHLARASMVGNDDK